MKMKLKKKTTSKLFLILIGFCLLVSCKKNINNQSAVAVVNDKYISQDAFSKELEFYQDYYTKKYGESYLESKNKQGKTQNEILQAELLDSMIKDQIMLNDLQKNKVEIDDNQAKKLKSKMEKSLGDKDSLKANLKALNTSEGDFSNIIFNDSIRKIHYDYFLSSNKIKDSEILEYYKKNEDLHRMYKYNVLVFDDKEMCKNTRGKIKSQLDFRNLLKDPVRSFSIINSEFVYKDDPLLQASKMIEKDKVSEIFQYDDKYMVLMINSFNENENELLINTKDKYLRDAYEKYLNKLIKSSQIRLFIW